MTQAGRSPLDRRQRAVVVVGCQVIRRRCPGRRRGDSRPPGPARCRLGAVLDVLADLAGRSRVAPDPDVVDLADEAIPAPGCGRPVVRVSGPDLVEAAREVLGRSRHGSRRAGRRGRGSSSRPAPSMTRATLCHCPSLTGAIRRDLLDRAESRVIRPAVELAVGTDIERRNPSVGRILPRARRLIAEDDTAAGGLEPGLEGLARLGAVDQAVGQADVVRAVELEAPRRGWARKSRRCRRCGWP